MGSDYQSPPPAPGFRLSPVGPYGAPARAKTPATAIESLREPA